MPRKEHSKFNLYLASLRLERWPRSLAVLPGLMAYFVLHPRSAGTIDIGAIAWKLPAAFFLTLLISTANYIINEITDAPHDAHHPAKKDRPLVNNEISVKILLGLWCVLVAGALLTAHLVFHSTYFTTALLALLVAGILYNVPPIRVKDIPFLDSTLESANNPIRFLIGWHMFETSFPPISLLLAWWAFGNFLMVGKRVAEKKFLSQEASGRYRRSLEKYNLKGLVAFMIVNALVFTGTFCWFALEMKMNTFLFSVPFILVYLVMFMKKSMQDIEGAEEPERLLRNPYFAFYTLFLMIVFVLAYIFK